MYIHSEIVSVPAIPIEDSSSSKGEIYELPFGRVTFRAVESRRRRRLEASLCVRAMLSRERVFVSVFSPFLFLLFFFSLFLFILLHFFSFFVYLCFFPYSSTFFLSLFPVFSFTHSLLSQFFVLFVSMRK